MTRNKYYSRIITRTLMVLLIFAAVSLSCMAQQSKNPIDPRGLLKPSAGFSFIWNDNQQVSDLSQLSGETGQGITSVQIAILFVEGDQAWTGTNWGSNPGPWLKTVVSNGHWKPKFTLPSIRNQSLPKGHYAIYALLFDRNGMVVGDQHMIVVNVQ